MHRGGTTRGTLQRGGELKTLNSNQVQLDLCIAMLTRPKIQRSGIDFVDNRSGKAGACKINALQVMLAGIASFDANVVELRRMEIAELRRFFFTAIRAHD